MIKKIGIAIFLLIAIILLYANLNFSNRALVNLTLPKLGLESKDLIRDIGSDNEDPLGNGVKALVDKDFAKATQFFETIPTINTSYTQARLYLAYAQFELKDYQNTIANTKIVIEQSANVVNQQAAEWLQLQAMLASGNADDTTFKRILQQMAANKEHLMQAEANELQGGVNSFWRAMVF